MKRSHVLLFGPPGSGKGSVAEDLLQHSVARFSMRVLHANAGQLLRDLASAGDPLGVRLRDEYWGTGNLVPSAEITKMFLAHLTGLRDNPQASTWRPMMDLVLLDGYPRREDQAEALFASEFKPESVIVLQASDDELLVRLLRRGRSDDTPETIKHRFEVYRAETLPVLSWIAKNTDVPFHFVNASGTRIGTMHRIEDVLLRSDAVSHVLRPCTFD